jgi:integrase
VKEAVDSWTVGAGITSGPLLRPINKAGRVWGHGFTPKVIWAIVKANAKSCGLPSVAPHDLRSCARLCHQAGGELDQIQFLLGHVSIQTTERYYVQKVDMCSGCPKSPIVNARTWLDSA